MLSRLEQLGFECVVAEWLELDRGAGRLLRMMVEAAPAVVRREALAVTYARAPVSGRRMSIQGLKVRIHRLRTALADVGFPDVIVCIPREGWGLSTIAAAGIRAAVAERAA